MTFKDNIIVIEIKVIPNSSINSIIIEENFIKIKLTAPPVDNKANKSLIEYLSKLLKVPKSLIKIKSGDTSKNKKIEIPVSSYNNLIALI